MTGLPFPLVDVEFDRWPRQLGRKVAELDTTLPLEDKAWLQFLTTLCAQAALVGHSAVTRDGVNEFCRTVGLADLADHWEEALDVLERSDCASRSLSACPLVFGQRFIALHRYARYEHRLSTALARRLNLPRTAQPVPELHPSHPRSLFAAATNGETDWQALAVATALNSHFTIIAGGPGTGKTYTVLRVIAALVLRSIHGGHPLPEIALAAPTGKAAQRLSESINGQLEPLLARLEGQYATLRDAVPKKAQTLHRLLGYRPDSIDFRHGPDNPLPADVLIVDECSMIDLPLMTKAVEALPPHAQLVLLGDPDQLGAVDTGSPFADLLDQVSVEPCRDEVFAACGQRVDTGAALHAGAHHVILQRGYRSAGPVSDLASKIRRSTLNAEKLSERVVINAPEELESRLRQAVREGWFSGLLDAEEPALALQALSRHALLAGLRRGPFGVEKINAVLHHALAERYGFDVNRTHFHGQPLMVLSNSYRTGLFNGDVGVLIKEGRQLRAWFTVGGDLRSFALGALPPVEPCFAMTVHKAQGSEYDQVTLVLPPASSPLLDRRLFYTGVTRARNSVEVWAPEGSIEHAVSTINQRMSQGLEVSSPVRE